ncbi:MAG: hypothetical protein IJT41_08390 [Clostridia bacterium]|nr:hypothetical protein [Clostridia bacterium]
MSQSKNQTIRSVFDVLVGALWLGMLWRLRGSHGWGAAWGVLACGFGFVLYLTAILGKDRRVSFAALSVTAFSFMLTTPSWGTFLSGITGIQSLNAKGNDAVVDVIVHPLSSAALMLCLGFGMVAVFGVLLGKCFGGKAWRLRDYAVVLVVFYAVTMLMQATLSHVLIRALQPEAVRVFAEDLSAKGISDGVFRTYLSHFGNIDWGKKYLGGRHYFAAIETISRAFAAAAVILAVRFIVKDKQAAKTGAVVCGAFAFAITAADVFFFIGGGGLRGAQGLALPDWIAAWSTWEYCTGFLAGGIITAYVRRLSVTTEFVLPEKMPQKAKNILGYVLFFIAGLGVNVVRPMLVRMDESPLQIPGVIVAVLAVIGFSVLVCRKWGVLLENAPSDRLAAALVAFLGGYYLLLYLFAYEPQIHDLRMLHSILVLISYTCVTAWCIRRLTKPKTE